MKLKRATYRHIEAEIYAYEETVKQIEQLRQDIILAGNAEIRPTAVNEGWRSSSVERRATKLADYILLREMERITGAIRDTYIRCKEEARRVIWVKYGLAILWEPPDWLQAAMAGKSRFDMRPDDMAAILNMDRATFYRYKNGFIYGIAERLGWY
ncbi:phage transcriptional activator, RinA family [Thermanaeromonas toyohensis ToBE]|uniref:Phage transcriptional activator, RinA family n=1 Tax=Thermanaeromonas toyohensis ToBE TaxID=698762 RepID=A0A1W1VX67_9FIRM|nr:hypothetical protein [Thermanaeromonas toyohensis]SMB97979.1 phage transcriptional activator, RinA family [Thermanaeromonas toyohensis ToBE]